ncbi:unnamed protein product [Amoebophrya sp. A120]|nr:unnamed protein product [Amoebophrya sp. A120]|eukprot:GSA120T00011320001.1
MQHRTRHDWRRAWRCIGLMSLRCLIHCHQLPCPLSPLVWSAVLGQCGRLPPDTSISTYYAGAEFSAEEQDVPHSAVVRQMHTLRANRGDTWARELLNYFLHCLSLFDPNRERSYRWMLSCVVFEHKIKTAAPVLGALLPVEVVADLFDDLLDERALAWLKYDSHEILLVETITAGKIAPGVDTEITSKSEHQQQEQDDHDEAKPVRQRFHHLGRSSGLLEWVILWDIYLHFIGDSTERWDAYSSFSEGLTMCGRFARLFTPAVLVRSTTSAAGAPLSSSSCVSVDNRSPALGLQFLRVFINGKNLSGKAVLENVEFQPEIGYEKQQTFFKSILTDDFTRAELQKFLSFAISVTQLPISGKFPGNQKLLIRFLGDGEEDVQRLPAAHTCTWTVDMPVYDTKAVMLAKLRQAIELGPLPFAIS